MTGPNCAVFRRFLGIAMLVVGIAGCDETQRPAPVYYGQPPGYVASVNRPSAPSGYAPPTAPAPVYAPRLYSPPTPVYSAPPPSGPSRDQITIEHGETLYAIARRYQVPLRAIIDANHLDPPYHLVAGRTLVLPQSEAALPPRAGPTPPPPSPSLASAPPTPPPSRERPAESAPRTESPEPTVRGSEAVTPPSPAPPNTPSRPPETASVPPAASAPAPRHGDTTSIPPPPRDSRGFLWPAQGRVIAHFGAGPNGTQNDGIDISAADGTPVLAAEAGVVAYAGNELRGYGNLILIKHADGWMTAYGHNSRLLVKRGDHVQRGQVIAHVGSTGAVSEPQLHFELRNGTRALDPLDYLGPLAAAR